MLHRLVDAGNTVILIEHNLDVIKNADWIIDLGPGAGDKGGRLIAEGTPEQLARNAKSHTGKYLKPALETVRKEPSKTTKTSKNGAKPRRTAKEKEPVAAAD